MRPDEAARTLQVDLDNLTTDDVRKAFAEKAKSVHPDTASETSMSAAMLKTFKQARDVLIKHVEVSAQFVHCETCDGTGRQKTRSGGLIKCMTCAGEGRYKPRSFRRG